MPSLTYKDPFLAKLVSTQNEDDAAANVASLGEFPDSVVEQLTILRAYVLCCGDNVKAQDDIFSVKMKFYKTEYESALALARSKTKTGVTQSIFSIPIGRA